MNIKNIILVTMIEGLKVFKGFARIFTVGLSVVISVFFLVASAFINIYVAMVLAFIVIGAVLLCFNFLLEFFFYIYF